MAYEFRYWAAVPSSERQPDSISVSGNSAVGKDGRCMAAALVPEIGWRRCEKFGNKNGLCRWHELKMKRLSTGEFIAACDEVIHALKAG